MRKNIVAGNWKMNTTVPEGVQLAKEVVAKASEVPASVKLIIAPPFTHLAPVAEAVKGSVVGLSAQNCADKEKGAYTGEVSVAMLASVGCGYTILGHSENFNALLTTIRNFLPLINSEYAKALLLVAAYGCSDNARFHDLAHEIVDPWRKTDPVKKNKRELIRRLDDYDRRFGH